MKIAVVGATGLVGTVMLKVLEDRNFQIGELLVVATENSVGKKILFRNKPHTVISMEAALGKRPDIALFSAGGSTSLLWAPKFAAAGTHVIDNSSAWRMDKNIKLVVPEINAASLTANDFIIANPNCSTIQMVMALAPLHKKYKINRIVVSTYQSVTGTGMKALHQLEGEQSGKSFEKVYAHSIYQNVIPHCDVFTENGYTKEEMKLVNETRKILGDDNIRITATAVRVPVKGGHSESINVEFENDYELADVYNILRQTPGLAILDAPMENIYPMPVIAEGKDEVFVGRLRRDESHSNSLNLWVVADNLRKGAATNAVQIAEYLVSKKLIKQNEVA